METSTQLPGQLGQELEDLAAIAYRSYNSIQPRTDWDLLPFDQKGFWKESVLAVLENLPSVFPLEMYQRSIRPSQVELRNECILCGHARDRHDRDDTV